MGDPDPGRHGRPEGLLDPEAGQAVLAALEPLARPHTADDARSGDQRRADALVELARRALEGGQLPQTGGVRLQLLVTVDLDSLLGHQHAIGGEAGWAGPLSPEACRRLACDGALTRVLVTRHQGGHPGDHDDPGGHHGHHDGPSGDHQHQPHAGPDAEVGPLAGAQGQAEGLEGLLRAAMALLPRSWAAPPANPWMWGGPAGSSAPPSAAPSRCATGAVWSPTAIGPLPGARATTWSTGPMAAPPTWRIWRWCAGRIIGRSMRGVGS